MINHEVLEQCKKSIGSEIGTLSNLPYELANTIANFYYKSYLMIDASKKGVPSIVAKEKNMLKGLKKYSAEAEKMMAFMPILPGAIKNLQQINKNDPLYNYTVALYLDIFKYNIKNATNKSAARRMIERQFKKVNEIQNLIDSLKIL